MLVLAAALTLALPATGARFTGPLAGEPSGPVTGQADDLLVRVAVRPSRPGENYVTVNVQDTRLGPAPAPITDVRVSMRSAQRTVNERARRSGDGRFEVVGDQFDRAGRWAITVAVERPSLPDAVFVVLWTIGPPISSTRLPTGVSARPLAPILQTVTLLTAALFVGAAALQARATQTLTGVPPTPGPAGSLWISGFPPRVHAALAWDGLRRPYPGGCRSPLTRSEGGLGGCSWIVSLWGGCPRRPRGGSAALTGGRDGLRRSA